MDQPVKPEKNVALKVALVITLILVLTSCLLFSAMFGLLLLSATPEQMPIRWSLMCTSPFIIFVLAGASALAYKKRLTKLMYGIPIVLIIYAVTITMLFSRLNPDQ